MKYVEASAVISECGRYRYQLARVWDPSRPCLGVGMLNPSTADGTKDDPTIKRVVSFADAWGFGGIVVCNLAAWRATDPKELRRVGEALAIGPANDEHTRSVFFRTGRFVAGWGALTGAPAWVKERAEKVLADLTRVEDVYAFRITAKGMPEHPLYLPGNLQSVVYRSRRAQ